jgi:serine/threonine protein phosphatase 1
MRYYAIGDIHGQLGMLEAVHARIARDREETGDAGAPVIHLGDLVDRGPDSRGVIDFLMEGIAGGAPWMVLKGNHEAMFLDLLAGAGETAENYFSDRTGGLATVASYGVRTGAFRSRRAIAEDAKAAVPESHRRFLAGLPMFHARPGLLFVHAGIRPGVPITLQEPADLLWIRGDFLESSLGHGALVVHGHTPVEAPEHWGNRVNLDTGAGFGRRLTAAVFEGTEVWVLGQQGREPLRPPA